eukprot:7459494-Alexandrium_andersonii.AAC.1
MAWPLKRLRKEKGRPPPRHHLQARTSKQLWEPSKGKASARIGGRTRTTHSPHSFNVLGLHSGIENPTCTWR